MELGPGHALSESLAGRGGVPEPSPDLVVASQVRRPLAVVCKLPRLPARSNIFCDFIGQLSFSEDALIHPSFII